MEKKVLPKRNNSLVTSFEMLLQELKIKNALLGEARKTNF